MEEKSIWEKLRNGDLNAKNILVEKYFFLVKYLAGKMYSRLVSVIEYNDLVSEGSVGLLEAMQHFDFTRGIKFETYATSRIRGHILDYLRKKDILSRNHRKKLKDLEKTQSKFYTEKGHLGNHDEIREFMGLSKEEYHNLIKQVTPVTLISLDYNPEYSNRKPLKETLNDEKNIQPENVVLNNEIKEEMVKAFELLSQKEKDVMALYYYEDLTLKEISKSLNISESRISQIHSSAIIKLRSIFSNLLKEF